MTWFIDWLVRLKEGKETFFYPDRCCVLKTGTLDPNIILTLLDFRDIKFYGAFALDVLFNLENFLSFF